MVAIRKAGAYSKKYARPYTRVSKKKSKSFIKAVPQSKIVKFTLAGVASSNKTFGHRFTKKTLTVKLADISLYKKALFKASVILDQNDRRELIKKQVLKSDKGTIIDQDLLNEVANLVETPWPVVCQFKPEFLKLPKEVLVTTMKKNQKYFPIANSDGTLTNRFVVITNGCKYPNIKDGNQKVISARLSDAKFFFDEDQKVKLADRVEGLSKVQFFEGLGTLLQKTERLVKLSSFIGTKIGIPSHDILKVERSALLSKGDLISQMVFEFPELQGIMGREYAKLSGEDVVVADGIFEHYLPRFADDILPESKIGIAVSIADKIDNIVGCFATGKIPTGSADPYGLRRAVLGIIKIIQASKLDMDIKELFAFSFDSYGSILAGKNFEEVYKGIISFLFVRFKAFLLDLSIPHNVIEGVSGDLSNILFAIDRAIAINASKENPYFKVMGETHDRIRRISKDAKPGEIIETLFENDEERALFQNYKLILSNIEIKLSVKDFIGAIEELSSIISYVQLFFDKTLVMHQDEKIKNNRLTLLKLIDRLFLKVADFTKISN